MTTLPLQVVGSYRQLSLMGNHHYFFDKGQLLSRNQEKHNNKHISQVLGKLNITAL